MLHVTSGLASIFYDWIPDERGVAAFYASSQMPLSKVLHELKNTHTHTHNRFTALWIMSRTTQVSWYQKKHSPTHTYRGHQSSLIHFIKYDPQRSPCSIYVPDNLSTISQFFVGLPVGLAPSTSYSIHFFTKSLSSFHSICPYHCNLFCCSTEITSSNPSLSQPFT